MKRVEIKLQSVTSELEKLIARKERAGKKLEKATAKVKALGCDWTWEEHRAFLDTAETNNGWMVNKDDIKKNGAWLDWIGAERDLTEVTDRIERVAQRFEKAQAEADEYRAEVEKIEDAKKREELQKLDFEEEKKEWAKDGINLKGRYYGTTPNGEAFFIAGNSGYTRRSLHCYTLTIKGETIFTSGEFWRCYMEIKNR